MAFQSSKSVDQLNISSRHIGHRYLQWHEDDLLPSMAI